MRGYEDGIQISGGRPAFLALSLTFKADWQGNSDAATWSIWLLIHVSALRKSNVSPPPALRLCRPVRFCQITPPPQFNPDSSSC